MPAVAKKKNIIETRTNFKITTESSRSVLLTKNPQPILQSLGSEGDVVVSFWSFMVLLLKACAVYGRAVDVLACVCRANAEEFLRAPRAACCVDDSIDIFALGSLKIFVAVMTP